MRVKKRSTKKPSVRSRTVKSRAARADIDEVSDMSDNAAFWTKAELFEPAPVKAQVTMRIDADIIDWFKGQGRGYQTKMNAALRAFMNYNRR